MHIEPFDGRTADTATIAAVHAFVVAINRELYPEDEPVPLEEYVNALRHRPSHSIDRCWVAWDGDGRAIGRGALDFDDVPENRHLAGAYVGVLPDHRRAGLGCRLLGVVGAEAQRLDRSLLQLSTREGGPGEEFLVAVGAEKKFVEHNNRLLPDMLDRHLMEQWVSEAASIAGTYTLSTWDTGVPESDLAAFAALLDVMNDAPRGDLDQEDERNRPEHVAAWNATIAARGQTMWTVVVRATATAELAGWSSLLFPAIRKDVAYQLGTGVAPAHRGHGLGRWMKAVNALRLLDERPEVRRVETENATTNGWMLAINTAMGFRSFETIGWWELGSKEAAARA